jgi:hypothetical protein
MKHVKLYEAFSTSTSLTEEQIGWLDRCTAGSWNLNPSTGLIDVDGDFSCVQQDLTDFKGVRFSYVKGGFYCNNNLLTSLVGAPQTVGGTFYCHNNFNQLTSLIGAPQTVGGTFYCTHNQLTNLKGSPETVGGDFYCHSNELTSLEGAPQKVGGDFNCHSNELTDLKGAPQKVGGYFNCQNNQITSLEGAPQTIDGGFYCTNNPLSEETLSSIFALMQKGKSYQQALEEYWPNMNNEDRTLTYKDHSSLTPEEIRRYEALATVNRIKNYL